MPHFNAKPHEVRAMLGCDEFCAIRPLKPQPSSVDDSGRWYRMSLGGESLNCYDLPFSPGDVVTVKEAWTANWGHLYEFDGQWRGRYDGGRAVTDADIKQCDGSFVSAAPDRPLYVYYKADGTEIWGDDKWRTPAIAPAWASRLTLEILPNGVSVKRVQDVTPEEARLAGDEVYYAPDFETRLHYWDRHNPKHRWSDNPWVCIARCRVHHCNVKELEAA